MESNATLGELRGAVLYLKYSVAVHAQALRAFCFIAIQDATLILPHSPCNKTDMINYGLLKK